MDILLLLTTAGIDTGPFDLYENSTGPFVLFESAVDKIDLVTLPGYYTTVPFGTTTIRVQSTGLCDNYIDIVLEQTTTTSSTTELPYSVFSVAFESPTPSLTGYVDGASACAGTGTFIITLYTAPGNLTFSDVLSNGNSFFTNPSLDPSTVFNGGVTNNWYKTINPATNQAIRIDTTGAIDVSIFNC
jgi:hypothetical protein